jgi:hypothetical protein
VHWRACLLAAALVAYALDPHLVEARTFHCGTGDVSCLIAAINEANANGQTKNTIRLEAGTYTLTAVDNITAEEPNGLPVITSTLTITGQGAETTIIERDTSAPPQFRILNVAAAGAITLQRLTLRGGSLFSRGAGGGIFNDGILTIIKSIISQNFVGPFFNGGGIFNGGTLTITNSTISSNLAAEGSGGGISNFGALTITNSAISHNQSADGGGISNGGTLTITNSTISSNAARFDGNGIFNRGTLTLTNSMIVGNTLVVDTFDVWGGGIFTVGTVELRIPSWPSTWLGCSVVVPIASARSLHSATT